MRAWPAVAALLLGVGLAPFALAHAFLVGVVPDLPGQSTGDEAVAIGAVGPIDLAGWRVSDGEDTWTLPTTAATQLAAGDVLWIVGNATTWTAHQGPAPFLALPPGPRIGNGGDDLHLLAPDGTEVDAMAFGDKDPEDLLPGASTAVMFLRDRTASGWVDTDHAADWATPRQHRIGESRLDAPTFTADRLTLYASPDNTFAALTSLIDGASMRLHLHVYELRSPDLVDHLVAAKQQHPALDLQVLVDGNPVGAGDADRHATADALRRITAAGGHAVLAGNGRYDDHHLKVLVADDAVAVQSENWVPSGVPVDPSTGNRGWGAIVHDDAAAAWFTAWMAQDRAAWDATPFDLAAFDPTFSEPPRRDPRTGAYDGHLAILELAGPVTVRPLVAPDNTQDPRSDPVAALLASATRQVDVQQLDLALVARNDVGWSSDDPWTTALAAAAARGVEVRVQAAAPFAASDPGNGPELAWLDARGVVTSVMDRPGIGTLHNKAFVIDDGLVVLGSMNGNHHSRSENREVSLVIASPAAVAWARALVDDDLDPSGAGRDWDVPKQDLRGLPLAPWPTLLGILGVATILARR